MKKKVPIMPESYKGKFLSGCKYIKTQRRSWTNEEHDWVYRLHEQGYSVSEISLSTGRSIASIQNKIRRLRKKRNTYNALHVEEKYEINRKYAELIKPHTILDLYCGETSFWKRSGLCPSVSTNDKNRKFPADYHEKAERLICKLFYEKKKYDVIDLDPFGSAYDCFDLALKMAKKGLIVTFGEMGHKRLKRLDFVKTHYGIKSLNTYTPDRMIAELKGIAKRNKKKLVVVFQKEWHGLARVWFRIKPIKVTEQWKQK